MITAAPELASNESATTADLSLDPKEVGSWDAPFPLPNVAIHTHVLPNGKVLFWGRREHPGDSLDTHECTPHLWDPGTKQLTVTTATDPRGWYKGESILFGSRISKRRQIACHGRPFGRWGRREPGSTL